MKRTHVFCDFDGTVTVQDTNQAILNRFANGVGWRRIEDEWIEGRITSMECYRRQFALIQATKDMLVDYVMQNIAIDPTFPAFVDFCSATGLPLTILSDGFDIFIEAILRRANLECIPFLSNRLLFSKDYIDFEFVCSNRNQDHVDWKQAILDDCKKRGHRTIFIGDGLSDRGAATSADLLFAKSGALLASWCQNVSIPYIPFGDFTGLTETLRGCVDTLPK